MGFASVAKSLVTAMASSALIMSFLPIQAALGTTEGSSNKVFSVDGVTYAITEDNTAQVGTGINGEQAISADYSGSLDIPATVSFEGSEYSVTEIAPYACTGITGLTKVSIPASVTTIGFNAFGYCGIMDDSGNKPAYSGLTSVSIEKGSQLSFISERAFVKDYALKAFTIPANVVGIGQRAFQDCFSFESFSCEDGSALTGIGDHAFSATLPEMDPDKVASGNYGVGGRPSGASTASFNAADSADPSDEQPEKVYAHLKSVSLPASLKTLGNNAFGNQRALEELTWDDACEMDIIGYGAFQYCTSLKEASAPGVTHAPEGLGERAFQYCISLEKFTYKGVIRAPYSGYSERWLFRGDKNLKTVIYLADKYHQPFYTLTTIDTGRLAFTDCDPTVYYLATFYGSKEDAESTTAPLGTAVLREGTPYCDISANMLVGDEKGAVVYSGSALDAPQGYGWACSAGGGAAGVNNACALYPVKASDFSGAGIALSQSVFDYSPSGCNPQVTVKDSLGRAVSADKYTLTWERKDDDGTWSKTTDFITKGELRVTAHAISGSGYTGSTAPAEFSIDVLLDEDDTFQTDGVTYTVLTTSDSGNPSVMLGDGEHAAIDTATSGAFTVPSTVTPEGSSVPYAVKKIATCAFGGEDSASACNDLTSIEIPEGIESIEAGAFKNMQALESVSLPSSLNTIGANAFSNDESLENISFAGNSLASIGLRAFSNCQNLTEVKLPGMTETFAPYVFINCHSLSKVVFSGSIPAGMKNQFQGCDALETLLFYENNPGFELDAEPSCYAHVVFKNTNGATLGTADIAIGTPTAQITSKISSKKLLEGSVPALPSKTQWSFSPAHEKLTRGTIATATKLSQMTTAIISGVTYKRTGSSCSATSVSKASKAVTIAKSVKIGTKNCPVVKIAGNAFKGSKATVVTIKSTKLTAKKVKDCFKGSNVKTVKVPKASLTSYKKIFAKTNCGKKVSVKS